MAPVITAWDARWSAQFTAERAALRAQLGAWLTAEVEHIGSTAVRGLPAKPIIDMVAGVAKVPAADAVEQALTRLGYARRPHRVDATLFVKAIGPRDTHHLHLTVPGSDLWRERLAFRDALRRDPDLVERYARLKAELVRANGGRGYAAADKREFVRSVLAAAGVHLRDDRHADA